MFHMFFECFFVAHITEFIEAFAQYLRRKILLVNVVVGIIVCVFVANALAEIFMAAVMGVLKMYGHGGTGLFDGVHGGEDGIDSCIALGSAGHVGSCL